LAASVSNGSPDCDQLTKTEAVDVWNVREIQYECAMAFLQQFVHMFKQSDIKDGQSAVYIHNDDIRRDS